MFAVELCAAVRKFVFTDGNSRREATRVFGLGRDRVAKIRYLAPPDYVRTKPPERPKLGPLVTDLFIAWSRLADARGFDGGKVAKFSVATSYVWIDGQTGEKKEAVGWGCSRS